MEGIIPKPSIYYPDFIASNQETRANNIIRASSKQQYVQQIRNDIRQFKQHNNLGKKITTLSWLCKIMS